MISFPGLISVTARDSAFGDTVASTAVNNSGGDFRLSMRLSWVATGFMDQATERARSSFLVLFYRVFYSGPLVGSVGGVGIGFLVRLHVRAAIG